MVLAYVALLVGATVPALRDPGDGPRAPDPAAEAPGDRFIEAWRESRSATFVASGTFERFAPSTGARLVSEAYLAQDPPRRVQRELGGVQGRDGDRVLLCPLLPDGETGACRFGEPSGTSYAESVDAEVAALAAHVRGDRPLYAVSEGGPGCFDLRRLRFDPVAVYGQAARFCFDPETGAPTLRQVEFDGGVVERVVYTEIRTDVSAGDLEV